MNCGEGEGSVWQFLRRRREDSPALLRLERHCAVQHAHKAGRIHPAACVAAARNNGTNNHELRSPGGVLGGRSSCHGSAGGRPLGGDGLLRPALGPPRQSDQTSVGSRPD